MSRGALLAAAATLALAGCPHPPEPPHVDDKYFSEAASGVQCAIAADRGHSWTHEELMSSLVHAQNYSVVLHTVAHAPTLDLAEYWPALDWAVGHGVRMVTFRELTTGFRGAGWAFAVSGSDGAAVDALAARREELRLHGVHVTLFVGGAAALTAKQREELQALATDGHDIEAGAPPTDATLFTGLGLPAPVAAETPAAGAGCVTLTPAA